MNSQSISTTYRAPSHDEIAQRAHEIWQRQGCPLNRELENWFEAEHQLVRERTTGADVERAHIRSELADSEADLSGFTPPASNAPLPRKLEQVINTNPAPRRRSPTSAA